MKLLIRKKYQSELEEANEMINDSDPELSEMGKEESKRLVKELENLEEELRQLLDKYAI